MSYTAVLGGGLLLRGLRVGSGMMGNLIALIGIAFTESRGEWVLSELPHHGD